MTINNFLRPAIKTLESANISSARLDCLIMLSDLFGKDKAFVLANLDTEITDKQRETLDALVKRRLNHEPLAYIRGFIEFYGRSFGVTKDVMVPRPETEELVEMALRLPLSSNTSVIDVGTGSGNIAVTLKLERPLWQVMATDISSEALKIAKTNAKDLGAEIQFEVADLLSHFPFPNPQPPNLITANLPYVAKTYEISPEAKAEPEVALFAGDKGYQLIEKLLTQTAKNLKQGVYLILESDPWQQERIIKTAKKYDFSIKEQRGFHLVFIKNYS